MTDEPKTPKEMETAGSACSAELGGARTQDEAVFGVGAIVYCSQHLRPHETGWCTVPPRLKIRLESENIAEAYEECKKCGYHTV